MGESTALETLQNFCRGIIRLFGSEYLRKPTRYDMETLSEENAAGGFPGIIGSIDAMHLSWKIARRLGLGHTAARKESPRSY
jgi:hypothetical protein